MEELCELYIYNKKQKFCKLSLIIPTYNEAENISELIERIEKSLKNVIFEIIIVDDNSEDKTAEIAEKLNIKYGNIKILKRNNKLGLGSAVVDGIKKSTGEILGVMDADLQHPPELLPKMLEKIENGFDIVVASRYIEGSKVEESNVLRKLMSLGAVVLAHILLQKTRVVKDAVSGFFMFRREVIDGVNLNPIGYKILIEILVKGKYDKVKVTEIPYIFKSRKKGRSKLGVREIFNYVTLLLKLKVEK